MSEESYYSVETMSAPLSADVAEAAGLSQFRSMEHGMPVGVVMSELALSLRDALASSSARLDAALAGATATLATLAESPRGALLRAALEAEHPGLLQRFGSTVQSYTSQSPFQAIRDGSELAHAARTLGAGLDSAAGRLAFAERSVQLRAVTAALTDCGFRIERSGLWSHGRAALSAAGAGRTAVIVELDCARGHIDMDLQGFSGRSCEKMAAQLQAAMRRQGLAVRLRNQRMHGDPAGGVLVRRVRSALDQAEAKREVCKPVRNLRGTLCGAGQ